MSKTEGPAVPCRLHVVITREADIAGVFRRGPSKWWHGRLLIATQSGKLQVHDITRNQRKLVWERDLNGLTPDPVRSPDWARTW